MAGDARYLCSLGSAAMQQDFTKKLAALLFTNTVLLEGRPEEIDHRSL